MERNPTSVGGPRRHRRRLHRFQLAGRWEGEELVVDTRLFSDHRSPYQIGVPSGSQKRLIERYKLIDEGARILVEFVLEDPEYMLDPLVHRRELIYSPDVEMVRFDCNQESTQRFLPG